MPSSSKPAAFWWPIALCLHLALLLNWGGIALQSSSIYLFALIIPLTIWYRRGLPIAKGLGGIAAGLAMLWLIFPISNLLVYGLDQLFSGYIITAKHKSLMSSHVPSTVMALAFILAVASWVWPARKRKSKRLGKLSHEPLWRQVLIGYSVSVLIVAAYLGVQHVTGLDVRTSSGMINPGNLMPSGLYRVHGFYGHTLSLASNALALAVFFAILGLRLRQIPHFAERRLSLPVLCGWLSLVMVVFVYLAGSRAVMVVALVMAVAIGVSCLGRYRRLVLAMLGGSVIVAAGLMAALGFDAVVAGGLNLLVQVMPDSIAGRFVPLVERVTSGRYEDIPRLVFWRTHLQMILDQPIFGHGYAFMSDTTQLYYQKLGLKDYFRKYNAHNIYLQFVAETGLVGVLMLMASLRVIWLKLKVWADGEPFRLAWLSALLWAIAANALHGLTQNTFFDANVIALYVMLLAIVVWLPRSQTP